MTIFGIVLMLKQLAIKHEKIILNQIQENHENPQSVFIFIYLLTLVVSSQTPEKVNTFPSSSKNFPGF